ncbi:MAG TPA: alanine dehydrogenase [Methanotrichaceae archaeon]|nr:alanine dehydrogenase [Methanotrichaceae archaeon]
MFKLEVLWLSEDEVKSLLTMDDAIKAVENAFHDHGLGRTQMPPKSYLYFTSYDGDLRTMPAYLEGMDSAGVKIVNVHEKNPAEGLPTVMAILVLNSPHTGAPVAIMGATYLTSMRTGAAGGVAASRLARADSKIVGLVGAGVQARTQLMAVSRFFKIELVRVADRSMDRARALAEDCKRFLDCDYSLTTEVEEACDCDILITTTPSREPVVREAWIRPGTHINAIGADAKGKQELESSLTARSKVVVDDMAQAVHSGEVNVPISQGVLRPEKIYGQIGEILVGKIPGRTSSEEITIFDSTGLAIQDVATGSLVYQRALDKGLGNRMKFL